MSLRPVVWIVEAIEGCYKKLKGTLRVYTVNGDNNESVLTRRNYGDLFSRRRRSEGTGLIIIVSYSQEHSNSCMVLSSLQRFVVYY